MVTIGLTWFCVVCHGFVYWFGLVDSCFCLCVCLVSIVLSMVPACFHGFVHGFGFFFFLLIMKGVVRKQGDLIRKQRGTH